MKKLLGLSCLSLFASLALASSPVVPVAPVDANKSMTEKIISAAKNQYVQNYLNKEIPLDEFKKALGETHFLFENPGLKVTKVFDVSPELFYVKATNMVDMRQYGQMGMREMPVEIYTLKNGAANFTNPPLDSKAQQIGLKMDLSANKDKAAFTVGNGTEDIFVFTDPDCPYCEQFEKMTANLSPKLKLHVYLFPLDMHKDAKKKSEYILSQPANKRLDAYKKVQGEKTTSTEWKDADTKSGAELLDAMMKYQTEFVGVKGTPYIVDSKGVTVNRNELFVIPAVPAKQ
jgi:thiol:disulfide interchange protein DsbC